MQTRHTDARTQRERRSLLAELTVPSILKFPEFNSSTPPPFPPTLVFAKKVIYNVSDNP